MFIEMQIMYNLVWVAYSLHPSVNILYIWQCKAPLPCDEHFQCVIYFSIKFRCIFLLNRLGQEKDQELEVEHSGHWQRNLCCASSRDHFHRFSPHGLTVCACHIYLSFWCYLRIRIKHGGAAVFRDHEGLLYKLCAKLQSRWCYVGSFYHMLRHNKYSGFHPATVDRRYGYQSRNRVFRIIRVLRALPVGY